VHARCRAGPAEHDPPARAERRRGRPARHLPAAHPGAQRRRALLGAADQPDRRLVVGETGRLAEAQVAEETGRVVVDIRPELLGLPADLVTRLVGEAFAHPAVRAQRPILVTLPRGDSAVLQEVEAHLDGALSRVAGVTCLVEGRVRVAR